MPRRKLARRFEPRFGVSQSMLEMEATWVAREAEDHGLYSTNDLREQLARLRKSIDQDEADVLARIRGLADSQQLILRCLLARDFWHIIKLYQCYLKSQPVAATVSGNSSGSPRSGEEKDSKRLIPFTEWLFNPAKA